MALQVVSPAVSVYRVLSVNDRGQEVTEDHIYKRGEALPDWVTPFQQYTLISTGMAREVGDLLDPRLVESGNPPAPVVLPEHNPSAVIGSGVSGPRVVERQVEGDGDPDDNIPAKAADVELPDDSATKPVWEEAALDVGLDKASAESMRKPALLEEVKRRQSVARERRDLGGPDSTLPPARS
jgi:hypothetical protein